MNSRTTESFRPCLAGFPSEIRAQARQAYLRFRDNPDHPGLRFKRLQKLDPIYSVRISRDYRAVGLLDGNDIIWFWVGSHADYEKVIDQLA